MNNEHSNVLAGVACAAYFPYKDYANTLRSMASSRTMVQRATLRVMTALAACTAESLDYMDVY